jgi:hypothetical protein
MRCRHGSEKREQAIGQAARRLYESLGTGFKVGIRPAILHASSAGRDLQGLFLIGDSGTRSDLRKAFETGIDTHIERRLGFLVLDRLSKELSGRSKSGVHQGLVNAVIHDGKETYRGGRFPQLLGHFVIGERHVNDGHQMRGLALRAIIKNVFTTAFL